MQEEETNVREGEVMRRDGNIWRAFPACRCADTYAASEPAWKLPSRKRLLRARSRAIGRDGSLCRVVRNLRGIRFARPDNSGAPLISQAACR